VPDIARELLRREIATAFGGAPYPGDEGIVSKHIMNGHELHDPERRAIAEVFKGLHWSAVSHETLMRNQDSLSFFTPDGLRFFLPAYLMAALDGVGDIRGFVVDFLRCPDRSLYQGELRAHFLGQVSSLSPGQRNAVKLVLEYLKDSADDELFRGDVTAALERYWSAASYDG
jgi:hypothetical protein